MMKAIAKGLRVPPRKMNVVASLVRRRNVDDALTILEHTPRQAAVHLRDVVKSAAANAEHNDKYETDQLQIDAIEVNTGGMIVRGRPAAKTNFRPHRHRLSNVTVELGVIPHKGAESDGA
jgi:large subunit ribosomal protein L22